MAVTLQNAKFSDIDLDFCKDYLRIDYEDDDVELNLYLISAKAYVCEHSEKSVGELDNIAYAPICVIKLVADMYSNKNATVGNSVKQDLFFEMLMNKIRSYNL